EQELQRARAARDEADTTLRLYSDSLAAVAHDLKSPLATIKGLAQLLVRSAQRPQHSSLDLVEALTVIDGKVSQMASMIDELLFDARLHDTQPLELALQEVELIELVRRTVAEH